MQRIARYNSCLLSNLASKSFLFLPNSIKLRTLIMVAGLYKPQSINLEHGLVLSSIAGALAVARPQLHGKREKRTVSLTTVANQSTLWQPIDKLLNELLPRVSDFKTIKFRKPSGYSYTLRLKQKLAPLVDFEDLVSSSMYDTHRGVFLPLTSHFNLQSPVNHSISEHYLRMLRLPFNFYVKRKPPAFDDSATFAQNF